jgi:hypothetical protein
VVVLCGNDLVTHLIDPVHPSGTGIRQLHPRSSLLKWTSMGRNRQQTSKPTTELVFEHFQGVGLVLAVHPSHSLRFHHS